MKVFTLIKVLVIGILFGSSLFAQHPARVIVIDPNTGQMVDPVTSPNQNPIVLRIFYTKSDTNDFEVSFGLENHDSNSIFYTSKVFEFSNPTYNSTDSTYSEIFIDTFSFFHPTYMHDLIVDNTNPIKLNQSWKFHHYFSDFEIGFGIPFMSYTGPNGYYIDSLLGNYVYGGTYGSGFGHSVCEYSIPQYQQKYFMDSVYIECDYIGIEVDFMRYLPYGNSDSAFINVNHRTELNEVLTPLIYEEQYSFYVPEDSVIRVNQLIGTENFGKFDFRNSTYFDNLFIYPVYDHYICEGDSLEINGVFVFDEGVYIDSLFTALGTDSIIGINVKFNDVIYGDTIEALICEGDSYIIDDTTMVSNSGLFSFLTLTAQGCDSVFYLDLDIQTNTISLDITNTNNVLSYDDPQADYTYQWINVLTGQPIVGETSSTFTPSNNGTYAVEVSNGVCTQVSNSSLTNIGLDDLAVQITCTPNPFINSIELSFGDNSLSGFVEVFDVNSKLLMTSDFNDIERLSLDTEHLPNGIYLIKIKTTNGLYQKKMIK